MQAKFDPSVTPVQTESPTLLPAGKSKPRNPTDTRSFQSEKAAPSQNTVYGGLLESNVTFRRDTNGQIFYVVTDAKSGKELREVPAQEIRKTGEGIAEFLKREQEKSNVSRGAESLTSFF